MVPLIGPGQSDTACIDNALELLVIGGGYSLAHAMMMLIPEAWAGNPLMDPQRRAFYEYHAALMEPWDGPAAIAFTDGRQIGATLDRNGLRPARYIVTDDDQLIMASEAGVLPVPGGEDHPQMAATARQDAADRPRRGPHHRRRRDQARTRRRASLRGLARSDPVQAFRIAGPGGGAPGGVLTGQRCRRGPTTRQPTSICSRPSATPRRTSSSSSSRWRAMPTTRSARWAPTRRSPRCRASPSCSTTTSSRISRRSPTRRSIRSARNW